MNVLRRAMVLAVVAVGAGLGAGVAHACSCVSPPPFDRVVAASPVAFVGTVTGHSGDRYTVRVDSVLKGTPGARVTLRVSGSGQSSCGVRVPSGPVLFAGDTGEEVNLCSPFWTGDDVARVLATSRLSPSPLPPPSEPPQALPDGRGNGRWIAAAGAVAGVAVAAALVGVMLVRRRRSAG